MIISLAGIWECGEIFPGARISYAASARGEYISPPIEPLIDSPATTIGSDFNGDGIHDLIVGAHLNDDIGTSSGSAYILYGTSNLSATYELSGLGGLDVTLQGNTTNINFGYESSSAGDLNADGFDDIVVGSSISDEVVANGGSVWIIYGSPNLSATIRTRSGGGDVTILADSGSDYLGYGANAAGDFNGDGFDDLITSAPFNEPPPDDTTSGGAAYLLFGSASLSQTYDLSGTGVSATLVGIANNDQFGIAMGGAGDVNLDGFDDVIIGAHNSNEGAVGGADDTGAAYILYGGSSISGTITAGNHDVTIIGKAINDYLGRDVSGLSDINNDGFDDVMAGARLNDDAASGAGAAYILYGRRSLSGTFDTELSQENISLLGKAVTLEFFGISVSGCGDVNDDGFYDFIVGAYSSDDGGPSAGAAYVVYGGPSLPPQIPAGNNDVTILGRNGSDLLGRAVAGIGDINNDGISDIAVGAVSGEGVTAGAGAAYIIFGAKSISATIDIAGAGADVTIAGRTVSDELGRSIGGGHMNRGP